MRNLSRKAFFCLAPILLLLMFIGGCGFLPVSSEESRSFSFIYMSDPQADPETGDYSAWGAMLANAVKDESKPAFVMIGGDLVNDGNDQQEWDDFFAAGEAVLQKLKLYPTMGNHDNSSLYKTVFELPENGPAGKEEAFYSFDHGDAHFTVMDSNAMGAADQEDIDWLKADLHDTDRKYKIVMFHHPAYPAIDIPKDTERAATIRQHFVPVMEEAGVDLVLNGHQHVYMRSWPLLDGKRNEDGIVYLMGNSGGKQYSPGSFDYIARSVGSQPLYSIITIKDQSIIIETRDTSGNIVDTTRGPAINKEQQDLTITVRGDGIEPDKIFTLKELADLPGAGFEKVYSTINNWPTPRFYAARGITVRSILHAAGVLDTAQVITFRSPDSYEMSFTREQLIEIPRFTYPGAETGSAEGAEPAEAIIAYEYKEGSADLAAAVADTPCLIIGQSYPGEHTNPAFVVGVNEIIVSQEKAQPWDPPSIFPAAGKIAAGELVKLQHQYLGRVKIHYTLDGSAPSQFSPMYNPSTYQPELNRPIPIEKDSIIQAFVTGYGRPDSETASFSFDVNE